MERLTLYKVQVLILDCMLRKNIFYLIKVFNNIGRLGSMISPAGLLNLLWLNCMKLLEQIERYTTHF